MAKPPEPGVLELYQLAIAGGIVALALACEYHGEVRWRLLGIGATFLIGGAYNLWKMR